ncbi:MAG: phage tail protein [Oculatellaceae cyanobacterium Prado106]|jgi:phage tail-like protein|nr:phage tail protein [Oculatellaceae cyanobacterium Prado106]
MAAGEILACSKFYFQLDGFDDLIVKSVSGVGITLQTAGDAKSYGVSKGAKSVIQATVTGIENGKVTVEYVSTVEDDRLLKLYSDSHSEVIAGGGSSNKGKLLTGSLIFYNQGGEEAARWNLSGIMASSYKSAKMEAGATGLATETVEFAYHHLHRVK